MCIVFLVNLSEVSAQLKDAGKKAGAELDSLRKKEESSEDSVVFDAKYIRYTSLDLLADSTQTIPLDTSSYNFQNYSPLYQPKSPTINLGSNGLAYRDLLFNPRKTIGFDAGFHSFDAYMLHPNDVLYYRAHTPFTELYYMNGTLKEQVFKVIHSQNIKPNWNFGANYNRIVGEGFYKNQHADHLNAAIFSWYESKSKRYNLLANVVFNTIKAAENGSVVNDNLFTNPSANLGVGSEAVKLKETGSRRPQQILRDNSFFIKQFYYLGRVDTLSKSTSGSILPTQRVTHSLTYTSSRYKFFRNDPDSGKVFPVLKDSLITNDSTQVKNLRNEFGYSFYLRGKALSFIKNELKLDLALQHDLYTYKQTNDLKPADTYKATFQNITLKAGLGYRFSNRINIEGDLQQIAQGRNAGDFLYDAKTYFLLSKSVGRIVLGAYLQNKSPEQLFERSDYQLNRWRKSFDRTKVSNLSFLYENPKYRLSAKAEYFLINNYLYFAETAKARVIEPIQTGTNINLIKVSVGEHFRFRKFNWEAYLVYQKTDFANILRTPELYSFNSVYLNTNVFKVLHTSFGFDVRYNTPFTSPAYAINVSQFYNDNAAVTFPTYPIVDVWARANLKRSNLFIKYDYANRGLQSKGFYTVNRYPMFSPLLKFGVSWNFYN